MADAYCDKTDLLVRDCAHCRGVTEPAPAVPSGNWITARYPGRCVNWHRIEPGDRIRSAEGDGWYCADCD